MNQKILLFLLLCTFSFRLPCMQTLSNTRKPIDIPDIAGETPLHYASKTPGATGLIVLLLEAGADMMLKNSADDNVLTVAVKLGIKPSASLLMNHCSSSSPLHKAVSSGNPSAVKALLEKRADVSVRNVKGQTALCLAIEVVRDTLREAKKDGTAPEDKNEYGNDPVGWLMKICPKSVEIVKLLASPEAQETRD